MKKFVTISILLILTISFFISPLQAQDLSGLSICIDPGHGINTPNQGPTGLTEHIINVRVARFLESYLKSANVDTVILTVDENSVEPGLSAREDIANQNGVDWFHSIHHNAWNGKLRYTLVLYEEIPYQKVPEWPGESDTMSYLMGFNLWQGYRTTHYSVRGDWSFYGGANGGFNLGVLNDLQMPGELSEATFHDNPGEEVKLRNLNFLQFEGLALYKSFLQYYDAGNWGFAPLGGIIYNKKTSKPIDGATVVLHPSEQTYKTDNYHNGFYSFPELQAGKYVVEVTVPGYEAGIDSIQVAENEFNFLDFYLYPHEAPIVKNSQPAEMDSAFSPYGMIEIEFNREMNTQSVKEALSVEPDFPYVLLWSPDHEKLRIDPKPVLLFGMRYIVTIDTMAHDIFNHPLDGNGDGIVGDPFQLQFTTQKIDLSRPQVLATEPFDLDSSVAISELVRVTFNKPLNEAELTENNIYIRGPMRKKIKINILINNTPSGRSILTLVPLEPLTPATRYNVTLVKAITDSNLIEMEKHFLFQFYTEEVQHNLLVIDNLNTGLNNWSDPMQSLRSQNFDPDSTSWLPDIQLLQDSSRVARLNYSFHADGLLDVSLTGYLEPFRDLQTEDEIGVYLFGDSSLTRFRFYFKDSADSLEAGAWHTIDWYGWKAVHEKIGIDSIFAFDGGTGSLDGQISLAGFQLKGTEGNEGVLFLDDFYLAGKSITSIETKKETTRPKSHILVQSYPNPFSRKLNHTGVSILFKIPNEMGGSPVNVSIYNTLGQKVRELVNQKLQPGQYENFWNGLDEYNQNVPAGVYFFRVQVGNLTETRRLIILN